MKVERQVRIQHGTGEVILSWEESLKLLAQLLVFHASDIDGFVDEAIVTRLDELTKAGS